MTRKMSRRIGERLSSSSILERVRRALVWLRSSPGASSDDESGSSVTRGSRAGSGLRRRKAAGSAILLFGLAVGKLYEVTGLDIESSWSHGSGSVSGWKCQLRKGLKNTQSRREKKQKLCAQQKSHTTDLMQSRRDW